MGLHDSQHTTGAGLHHLCKRLLPLHRKEHHGMCAFCDVLVAQHVPGQADQCRDHHDMNGPGAGTHAVGIWCRHAYSVHSYHSAHFAT